MNRPGYFDNELSRLRIIAVVIITGSLVSIAVNAVMLLG